MFIQVLEEYKNRTEYRLLNNYCTCELVSIKALKKGRLVLPGIILSKMQKEELNFLNSWIDNKENQLIVLPAWNEMNLGEYCNTSVSIKIKRIDGYYNKIPINYKIETVAKDKLFSENGKKFGINYRRNLSSGLITVVTLPLLDYKLIEFENEFKNYFNSLIQNIDYVEENIEENNNEIGIDNLHVFLLILSAAEVQLEKKIDSSIFKYFGSKFKEEILVEKYKELIAGGYINNKELTDKGMMVVEEKNLKSFIYVIKERRENEDGWN